MQTFTNKYIVGLTGGIGSGKSTIALKFAQLGIEYIDADDMARKIVELGSPCLTAIVEHYGKDILLDNGQLNRRQLRQIIFNDAAEKTWLESLTHPAINNEIIKAIIESRSIYVLLVHPLLFETKKNEICDYTLAITVPKETQIQRVCSRDNIGKEMAISIMDTQLTNEKRCELADNVIKNNGDLVELDDKILSLHKILSALAHEKNK